MIKSVNCPMSVAYGLGNIFQRNFEFVVHPSNILCFHICLPGLRAVDMLESSILPLLITLIHHHREFRQLLLARLRDLR